MPTETQHLEQRVAALHSDLNRKDEQIDALTFSDNDRELSRRSWFDEAKRLEKEVEELRGDLASANADKDAYAQNAINLRERLERLKDQRNDYAKQLAERDALLADVSVSVTGRNGTFARIPADWFDRRDALSASAESSAPVERDLDDDPFFVQQAEPHKPAPNPERDERAEFEQAFVVQEGVFFSKERNEYRSMNGRSIEYTDATDLNLRLQGWQARAALDKSTEGASHE